MRGRGVAVADEMTFEFTSELACQDLGLTLAELPPRTQLDDASDASSARDAMHSAGDGVKSVLFNGWVVDHELREQPAISNVRGHRPHRYGTNVIGGFPHDVYLPVGSRNTVVILRIAFDFKHFL